jgi:hypothetical protein
MCEELSKKYRVCISEIATVPVFAERLTRKEAGLLLAPLCKACSAVVRAADAEEDQGEAPLWSPAIWSIECVNARINKHLEEIYPWSHARRQLQSCAMQIVLLHNCRVVQLVFDRRHAIAGREPSLLGCHSMLVLDADVFLERMTQWVFDFFGLLPEYAGARVRERVLSVLNSLKLRPRRGPGMQLGSDEMMMALARVRERLGRAPNPLLEHREYIAHSLSSCDGVT